MRKHCWNAAIASAFAVGAFALPGAAAGLETEAQKTGYSVGVQVGRALKADGVKLDLESFLDGMRAVMEGRDLLLEDAEIENLSMAYQRVVVEEQQERMMAEQQEAAGTNIAEAETFLAENGQLEGVETTASGLQYEVIEEGSGDAPSATDTVVVHYTGTFINGETFDSSRVRGEPATFALNQVIDGWQEGIALMKPGARYKLYIPPHLAYGEQGRGTIPPNSLLIFDVELLEVL